jgi:hypothetical protein
LPLLRSRLQAELLTIVLLTPGREWTLTELADRAGSHAEVTRRPPVPVFTDASVPLFALSSSDLSGAYQLAYDALRKSAASLPAAQGLRATSRGGHIAIQEAAQAQFGSTIKAFRSIGRIRRARNSFEYPTHAPGPSRDDVRDAIAAATQAHDAALKILEQNLLTPW